MNKIEEVARAICRVDNKVPENAYWSSYIPQAIAAIKAMREPTEDMVDAGEQEAQKLNVRMIWESMIDESLDEHLYSSKIKWREA